GGGLLRAQRDHRPRRGRRVPGGPRRPARQRGSLPARDRRPAQRRAAARGGRGRARADLADQGGPPDDPLPHRRRHAARARALPLRTDHRADGAHRRYADLQGGQRVSLAARSGAPDGGRPGPALPARGGPPRGFPDAGGARGAGRAGGARLGRLRGRAGPAGRAVGPGGRVPARPPRAQSGDRGRGPEDHPAQRRQGGAGRGKEIDMAERDEARLITRIEAVKRIESPDEMTETYRDNLIHLMTMQADSELAGGYGYVPWITKAP